MRNGIEVALLCLVLAACSSGGQRGGLYVYMDEQGNLVSGEMPGDRPQAAPAEQDTAATRQADVTAPDSTVLDYQPETGSSAVQEDSEPAEERFVTYIDGDGQVTRQRVDLAAERRAKAGREPGYEAIAPATEGGYLETVTPVEAGCCQAVLDEAEMLKAGRERLLSYSAGQSARIHIGGQWLPARVLQLHEELTGLQVLSFKQRGQYLHPQLLLLDDQGEPVLQVDNVFTRRFPESWSRYAYIDGTLLREPGQRYLVVYLGYAEGGLPGLVREPDSELAIEGSVVVRGY